MANWRSAWRHLDRAPELWRCALGARRPVSAALAYLGWRPWNAPRTLVLRGGGTVRLESYEDLVTAWIIFFRREYRLPRRAATVLDVGANIGCFSLYAARRLPAARLVSVEPFPPSFLRLGETLQRNRLASRVTAWPLGVAAATGSRIIPADGAPSQSLGMAPAGQPVTGGTPIDVVSLDELTSRACASLGTDVIDFVKMDVEGAEHEAVAAAPAAALRRIGALAMEYHPNGDREALFRALASGGLRLLHDRRIGPAAGVAHFGRG